MDQNDEIRARIRRRLADLGLATRGASLAADLGETTLRNFLKGMTVSLTTDTLAKLAPVLKTSQQWLLLGSSTEILDLVESLGGERKQMAIDVLQALAKTHGGNTATSTGEQQ